MDGVWVLGIVAGAGVVFFPRTEVPVKSIPRVIQTLIILKPLRKISCTQAHTQNEIFEIHPRILFSITQTSSFHFKGKKVLSSIRHVGVL